MTMTRQEQLDAVVRSCCKWPASKGLDRAYWAELRKYSVGVGFANSNYYPHGMCEGCYTFTRDEVEARKAELQNKPSWSKAPEGANILVYCPEGKNWIFGSYKDAHPSDDIGVWSGLGSGQWFVVGRQEGEVIGDWKETLEKRPAADDQPTPEEEEAFKAMEKKSATNSDLYPQYFKDVSDLQEIDVYAVHQLFDVDDPSGAIQHASKKLLLSGVRTGGKGKYKDIKEARDTLNRWLQMNEEKQ